LDCVQPVSNLEVQVARLVINAVENVQDLDVSWIVPSSSHGGLKRMLGSMHAYFTHFAS
jgi:hypothetical protein